MATTTTPRTITYNGYTHVLVRHQNGEQALWVQDEYIAGNSDAEGTYSLRDDNATVEINGDDDLDETTAQWKQAVEWDNGALWGDDDNA